MDSLDLGPARVRFTGRAEGDLGHRGRPVVDVDPQVEARRRQVVDRPWSWLRQVHGADVASVDGAGAAAGTPADAAVTVAPDAALCVLTADCAPVVFASREGVIGVAHAGWRGLEAGVIDATVAAMRERGATTIEAALGPCIHAECYEFSPVDLDRLVSRLGDGVRGRTSDGRPALDVPAAVRAAVSAAGVDLALDVDTCTACSAEHYSHRARGDVERQAAVAWLP